jgi:dihydroxyacetone kinase-like protein
VGLTIASRVGGTSGPIWGTAFLRAGSAAGAKTELSAADVVAMLRAAVAGIQARGGASLGDKTLLDALVPAIDRLEADLAAGGAEALANAAQVAERAAAEPPACWPNEAGLPIRESAASALRIRVRLRSE